MKKPRQSTLSPVKSTPRKKKADVLRQHDIFMWGRRQQRVGLWPLRPWTTPVWDDLLHLEEHKARLDDNTQRFMKTGFGNNALLSGARGSGKSSLIKALVIRRAAPLLGFIQVDREGLQELGQLLEQLDQHSRRFILCCDDLSFEPDETGYKVLKSILEGAWGGLPENVRLYATANRRHLLPENVQENDEQIHPVENVDEKISLSDRFGLWLSFHAVPQEIYLDIVAHWLRRWKVAEKVIVATKGEALRWALMRGGRSGRVAWQFAQDVAGRYHTATL